MFEVIVLKVKNMALSINFMWHIQYGFRYSIRSDGDRQIEFILYCPEIKRQNSFELVCVNNWKKKKYRCTFLSDAPTRAKRIQKPMQSSPIPPENPPLVVTTVLDCIIGPFAFRNYCWVGFICTFTSYIQYDRIDMLIVVLHCKLY